MFFICSLLDLRKRAAVVRVAGGRGVACNSHICHKMEHFLITVFLMCNESSRSEAVHVLWDSLYFLSLFAYFQNQRFFLAVIFSVCGLYFWACIWGLQEKTRAATPFLWFWPLGRGYSIAGRENSGNRILIIFLPRNLHFWTKILLTHTGC